MISLDNVFQYTGRVFGDTIHASRLKSISNGVCAVLKSEKLSIAVIGRALSAINGITGKSGINEIDRMLSNRGIDLGKFFPTWVRYLIGNRKEIVVAMDWTDFDSDDQSTLCIHLITRHGRASALVWKTFRKSDLKNNRNSFEDEVLVMFKDALPKDIHVTLLADRGFSDVKLYSFLRAELGFNFIIRMKKSTSISSNGKMKPARSYMLPDGEAHQIKHVGVTQDEYYLPVFICVHDKNMKDGWYLAVSDETLSASQAVKLYARRFTIEEKFRDIKDSRYGMGLSYTKISVPLRRDRLLLFCAIASTLLTILGAAGEALGLDRKMKVNTVKKRSHSLVNQGAYYFACIPKMKEEILIPLLEKYKQSLAGIEVFSEIFGIV